MAPLSRLFFLSLAVLHFGVLFAGEAGYLTVKRVVDGDTLLLSNNEQVRLIGVDTPEYHASAKRRRDARRLNKDVEVLKAQGLKASHFTKILTNGQIVKLEYDDGNAAARHRDRYGRLLAYVYLVPTKESMGGETVSPHVRELESFQEGFLNAVLIEAGYGHAYTRYPFKYQDRFLMYEHEARQTGRGLWEK